MCGVIYAQQAKSPLSRDMMSCALATLSHRGPDAANMFFTGSDCIGFGHTRLEIIGGQDGQQPIHDTRGRVTVIVNGEFYEHKSIRNELEAKGYIFTTSSDSEIVIHLYREYGMDFVHYLRGEFAIVLRDHEMQKTILVRDRFGIKPLQYFYNANDAIFYAASEAKALFALGVPRQWDAVSLHQAITAQYTSPTRTLFKDILQVEPGHMVVYDGTRVHDTVYWDLDLPTQEDKKFTEKCEDHAIEELHEMLKESVVERLETDGASYGCHLSGGVDSAMIAAMVSRYGSQENNCYTVSFPHAIYDESEKARVIAKNIGANLHVISVGPGEVMENLEEAVTASEGLSINSHVVGKYLLHKKMHAQGHKVVFTGEGADEVFGGYAHFKTDILGAYKQEDGDRIVAGVQTPRGKRLATDVLQKTFGFVPSFLDAKAAIGHRNAAFLVPDFHKYSTRKKVIADIMKTSRFATQMKGREKIDQSTYLWVKYALAGYILKTLGDGTEMKFSLEGRVPFLDHKLFEKARHIPQSLKIKNQHSKYILRKIAQKYLSDDVIYRTKQSFMAPPLSLLSEEFVHTYLRDLFDDQSFHDLHVIDHKKLLVLLDDLRNMSQEEQIAYEPTIMLFASIAILQKNYNLTL